MIGFMSNNIFPARVGELIRAFVLSKKESISFISVFASLIAERIMDGLTVSILAIPVIFTVPVDEKIKIAGLSFFIVFCVLLILLFFFVNSENLRSLLFGFLPRKVSDFINNSLALFLSGLRGLNNLKNSGITFISAFLIWFLSVLYFYFMGFAMDIHLTPVAALTVFVSVALGVVIPSSPGFIGVYHFFCQKAVEMFGVDTSMAFAYAVVTHFVQFVAVTGMGLIFLFYENISLVQISKTEKMGVSK
jgi:uncharacterized protein (TIRG00374 family)